MLLLTSVFVMCLSIGLAVSLLGPPLSPLLANSPFLNNHLGLDPNFGMFGLNTQGTEMINKISSLPWPGPEWESLINRVSWYSFIHLFIHLANIS